MEIRCAVGTTCDRLLTSVAPPTSVTGATGGTCCSGPRRVLGWSLRRGCAPGWQPRPRAGGAVRAVTLPERGGWDDGRVSPTIARRFALAVFAVELILWLVALVSEWLTRDVSHGSSVGDPDIDFLVTLVSGLLLLLFPLAGLLRRALPMHGRRHGRAATHPHRFVRHAGGHGHGLDPRRGRSVPSGPRRDPESRRQPLQPGRLRRPGRRRRLQRAAARPHRPRYAVPGAARGCRGTVDPAHASVWLRPTAAGRQHFPANQLGQHPRAAQEPLGRGELPGNLGQLAEHA